ncbi:MAG TPA: heavy metal-responsive transcriptional regulator [Pyrinomonadaceae bacterium]|nr:heavy metal-responsive transcriptional regulator [Pyrinomonadaceae bacterium]
MRAGELARAAGVSTDTLRHYERKGVLRAPRRSPNGYREYPPEALARVRLVRRALAFGFTLEELARVLGERGRGGTPCKEVRALAARKLADVEARLRELRELRGELRAILDEWDSRLAAAADGERAGLLESLAERPKRAGGERRGRTDKREPLRAPLRRVRTKAERRVNDDEET